MGEDPQVRMLQPGELRAAHSFPVPTTIPAPSDAHSLSSPALQPSVESADVIWLAELPFDELVAERVKRSKEHIKHSPLWDRDANAEITFEGYKRADAMMTLRRFCSNMVVSLGTVDAITPDASPESAPSLPAAVDPGLVSEEEYDWATIAFKAAMHSGTDQAMVGKYDPRTSPSHSDTFAIVWYASVNRNREPMAMDELLRPFLTMTRLCVHCAGYAQHVRNFQTLRHHGVIQDASAPGQMPKTFTVHPESNAALYLRSGWPTATTADTKEGDATNV